MRKDKDREWTRVRRTYIKIDKIHRRTHIKIEWDREHLRGWQTEYLSFVAITSIVVDRLKAKISTFLSHFRSEYKTLWKFFVFCFTSETRSTFLCFFGLEETFNIFYRRTGIFSFYLKFNCFLISSSTILFNHKLYYLK